MATNRYKNIIYVMLVLVSVLAYIWISYFTPRYQSFNLLSLYLVLFITFLLLYRLSDSPGRLNTSYWIGFIFRLSLLFLIPNLSDDIYRFLWDGHLTAAGVNPFTGSPLEILNNPDLNIHGADVGLFNQFGKDTYSSYPPLNQWIFALSVMISPDSSSGSVLVIRLILLLFEAGNILLIRRMLTNQNLSVRHGLLYILNPLVILEITGNLHFEGLMIFFLLLSIHLMTGNRWVGSSVAAGFAVLSKLIPLIFFPLIWRKLGLRRGFYFVFVSALLVGIAFLPFLDIDMIHGFTKSLGLYFQKFEFNASLYYLVREAGYLAVGYNIIQGAGPVLGVITLLLILIYSFSHYALKASLAESILWILMIYLAMATTIHPWYITTLIALSVFTNLRFPIVWSLLIFATYKGYGRDGYNENLWLIFTEYGVVYGWLIYEIVTKKGLRSIPRKP